MTSSSASSRKILSKIACNRLQKELLEWQVNPPAGFKHKVSDNLQRWVIEVNGAPGTLYSNETYQLQVDFPEHYPMEAPQVSAKHSMKRRGRASFEIDFEGMAGNWGWGKVGALDVKIWALEVEEERAEIVEFWI